MLQVICTDDTLIARGPDASLIERSLAAERLLEQADELRVTSELGTDVIFRRGGRPIVRQAGSVTKPGTWDSVGMGAVTFYPPDTEAEGTVVFNGPLFLIPQHQLVLDEPVRTRFEGGYIREVDTSNDSGRLLDQWLRSWNDEEAYGVAVVGFGLDPRARIEDMDISSWESYHGGVIIALGANIMPVGKGTRESKSHAVGVLLEASAELDGQGVLDRGRFTVTELA